MPTREERLAYGFSTSFLNRNDRIKRLVDNAIENGWTTTRFIDSLKNTSWWRNRSDAQKRFEAMRAENPGELEDLLSRSRAKVRNLAFRLGFALDRDDVYDIARAWVRNELDEDEVRDMVGRKYNRPGKPGGWRDVGFRGIAGRARGIFAQMAREYGFTMSNSKLNEFARNVARGRRTIEDYEMHFRTTATHMYEAVAEDIREGRTVREIIEPYMQIASEELGIPVATMNTTWSGWLKPISGDHRWSTEEWLQEVRTNSRYGWDETNNASRQASIMATQLMRTMGAQ